MSCVKQLAFSIIFRNSETVCTMKIYRIFCINDLHKPYFTGYFRRACILQQIYPTSCNVMLYRHCIDWNTASSIAYRSFVFPPSILSRKWKAPTENPRGDQPNTVSISPSNGLPRPFRRSAVICQMGSLAWSIWVIGPHRCGENYNNCPTC